MILSASSQRRVAITGLGIVCSAGRTVDQVWETLTAPGSRQDTATDADFVRESCGEADFSGHIDDFGELPPEKRKLIRKSLKVMNRETQLGVAAGQQALDESGAVQEYDCDRFGICFGAGNVSVMPDDFIRAIQACSEDGHYDADRWGQDGIDEMAPLWLLKCLPNMPACHLAIINGLQGPTNTITQRDVSGGLALAEACRGIRVGVTDAAVVGATGTTLKAFNLIHAQLDREVRSEDDTCRPFDRYRSGPTPGEGAGAVVLEELESAVRRGAHIYGEIVATTSASATGRLGTGNCRKAAST